MSKDFMHYVNILQMQQFHDSLTRQKNTINVRNLIQYKISNVCLRGILTVIWYPLES